MAWPRVAFLLIALTSPSLARAASLPPVEAQHGMVVSSQRFASEAGLEILQAGGNAVDAAVAVGYAEAVVNPCCGNIGGGGFITLRLADGRDRFLNFRETAPAAATPAMFLDAAGAVIPGESVFGYKAAGVPGTVLGLDTALRRYGTLPRAQVMAPAIRLARDGFVLNRGDTDILDAGASRFAGDPALARIFLRPNGSTLQPGDTLVQPDLARTLQRIADEGTDAFYRGDIPARVEAASHAGGGLLTAADFAGYTVTDTEPLRCSYRGYAILSSPPPSSGGATLCETLQILAGYDMAALGYHSAAAVHAIVEALRQAYLDRNTYLGDPAFVSNPLGRLLSADYAAAVRAAIPAGHAGSSREARPGLPSDEKPETTHYSVMDEAGNAASVTYTINGLFGAYVAAPGTGFLLNDEMDDFTAKPGVPNMFGLVQGAANAIAPGKRPLSSMAPTIVMHDGQPLLVLGSPGGSRIITTVLQTILNVIDYGMQPQAAVDAPRIHHQWLPDEIATEPFALSADTQALLQAMGYKIVVQRPWGAAEIIERGAPGGEAAQPDALQPGLLYGANDARRPVGAAIGY